MPDPATQPEWIDLVQSDDPRDVVHRAVACLARGGVVGLPADSEYVLAASALRPEAVARLGPAPGSRTAPVPRRFLAVRGGEELADWCPEASLVARRLAMRSWPGPLALVLHVPGGRGLMSHLDPAVRQAVAPDDVLGLRCPNQPLLLDILSLIPGPLVLAGGPDGPAASVQALTPGADADMILDAGPILRAPGLTVVRVDGESWTILSPGAVGPEELTRRAALGILFVCTGNTCRSPMAAALCRSLLAERLGCRPEEIEARGYSIRSAGVGAANGVPASPLAIEALGDRGALLHGHASQRITPALIHGADWILAMTEDHRDALLSYFPEAADRVRLLDVEGYSIDDPYGSDLAAYRAAAAQIEGHLAPLLRQLGL